MKEQVIKNDIGKIKVCHISSVHKVSDLRIMAKECASLVDNGYEVSVIAIDSWNANPNLKFTPFPSLPRLKRLIFGPRLMLKMALQENATIYHLHDPELLLIAKQLKKYGKKVIFDSHENVPEQIKTKDYIPFLLRILIARLYKKFEQSIISKIDGVIFVTPTQFENFKNVQQNLEMVTNYPILEKLGNEKRSLSLDEIHKKVCFAGGVSAQWNHKIIIESILNIKNCSYYFAGPQEAEYFEELEKVKNTSEKIKYLGILNHSLVKDLYESSFCGMALLSYNTQVGKTGTLGNTKLFEYMQHSLPFVCSDLTIWKEIVEKYDCGITVDPTNKSQIKNAISYLIENPERAKEMGENGYKAYLEEFNWDTQVPNLLKVYENIVQKI